MRKMWSKNQIISSLDGQNISPNNISASGKITGNEIIENMSGYSFTMGVTGDGFTLNGIYAGVVKNGNKLTLVEFFSITKTEDADYHKRVGIFTLPSEIIEKIYPTTIEGNELVYTANVSGFKAFNSSVSIPCSISKENNNLKIQLNNVRSLLTTNSEYFVRVEATFLLSDNLYED